MRYVVQGRYASRRDGQLYGPWSVGIQVELSEEDAAWVNRDSPGILIPVVEEEELPGDEALVAEPVETEPVEPEEDAPVAPKRRSNRMRTGGPTREEPTSVDF